MNSTTKHLFLAVFLLLSLIHSYSQNPTEVNPFNENVFTNISVEDGLSQSTVFSILKDSQGFMWFGTRTGGLNKYDGIEFLVYKNDPMDTTSLASDGINALFEDHAGTIWIGTQVGGLNNFIPNLEKFNRFSLPDQENGAFNTTSFYQTSEDGIWIGTNKGLYYFNYQLRALELILSSEASGSISSISSVGNKFLVFSSTEKIVLFDIVLQKIVSEYHFTEENVTKALVSRVTPVYVDLMENIWVGSVDGLLKLSIDENLQFNPSKPFQIIPPELKNIITSIQPDNRGNIWFGTLSGLVKYDTVNQSFSIFKSDKSNPFSLSHNDIHSLFIDDNQILWAGTWGGGVNIMSPLLRKFEHYTHQINNPESLSDYVVSSFAEDQSGVWVGTEQGGLNFFNTETKIFRRIPLNNIPPDKEPANNVKSLLLDKANNLWVGTYAKGLLKFNKESGSFNHFLDDNNIFALAQTPDNTIWAGTSKGLFKLNPDGSLIDHYSRIESIENAISVAMITVLLVDQRGDLWVGTANGGMFLYNPQENTFKHFFYYPEYSNTLSSNYITSLCEGDENTIWMGTLHGLNRFNILDGSISPVKENIDFPNQVINGIVKDDQQKLWLSTNKGIIHYQPDDGNFKVYDFSDGLQSNEFNRGAYFKTSNGKLYFGGINGFNSFYPSQIQTNPNIPKIQFTDFKLFYQSVTPGEPSSPLSQHVTYSTNISLAHAQSAFTIEFVALNYIFPKKNQYAYYLEGLDKDWHYVGNSRSASYMNLRPGKYIFHVKASNNDGVWNETGINLAIEIQPPYWRTPLAYAVIGFIVLMLLLLARSIIASRLKQQNQLQFQRMEVQRIEELNNMKIRFFTDISHEFKTPLTLISSPVDKLSRYTNLDDEFSYLIRITSKNVKRLKRLVDQLMTFRRIDKDTIKVAVYEQNMELFLQEIVDDFSELALQKKTDLHLHCENLSSSLQWFDKDFLDKIVFNLLSNAFKYTPKGGSIKVKLTIENDLARIMISDTGIGISPQRIKKIFDRFYTTDYQDTNTASGTGIGLALTKSLLELHHGSIEVKSTPEKGTTFTIILPVAKHHYTAEETSERKQLKEEGKEIDFSPNQPSGLSIPAAEGTSKDKIILIVEDNEDLRNYLVFNFSEYNTISAENGKEAMEELQTIIPDLIISDVMMPVMDGITMLRSIRENHVTSHIPFILLSAKTDVADKIEGIESGADLYIEKPFELDFLKASVTNLLEMRNNLKKLYTSKELTEPETKNIPASHKKFLEKAGTILTENISDENFSVSELGDALGLSRSQLFRKFKTICDLSPGEFIRNERLQYASKLLNQGELNVNEIAYQSGFNSSSYFITCFKKKYGKTPNEVMKNL